MAEQKPYLHLVFASRSATESRLLYDKWATTYDSDMAAHSFTAPALVASATARALQRSQLRGLRFLDAGCGTGTVGVELAKLGADCIDGVDFIEGILEVARKSGVYGELKCADLMQKLGFGDAEFDGVVCCGTFTHGHLGPRPLGEFVRVVKRGGVVVATVLESHWVEKGFEDEVERLVKEGVCEVVEREVHQYRKDAGGGRVLVLRSLR
ncbi:hypothetical protein M3J09_010533 [Ascochyta lentis]